jgi:hypothetical protein
VLVNDMPISEIIQHREIDIAVASIDLAGAEIAMSTKIGRERSLEKASRRSPATTTSSASTRRPASGLLTDQRADRGEQGDRPGPVRVSLDARAWSSSRTR